MSKVHTYSHFLYCNDFEWHKSEIDNIIDFEGRGYLMDYEPIENPVLYAYKEQFVKIELVEEPTWKSRLPEPDKRCMREIE